MHLELNLKTFEDFLKMIKSNIWLHFPIFEILVWIFLLYSIFQSTFGSIWLLFWPLFIDFLHGIFHILTFFGGRFYSNSLAHPGFVFFLDLGFYRGEYKASFYRTFPLLCSKDITRPQERGNRVLNLRKQFQVPPKGNIKSSWWSINIQLGIWVNDLKWGHQMRINPLTTFFRIKFRSANFSMTPCIWLQTTRNSSFICTTDRKSFGPKMEAAVECERPKILVKSS